MDDISTTVLDRQAGVGKRVRSALGFGIGLDSTDRDLPNLVRHLEYRAKYIAMPVGTLGSAVITVFAWDEGSAWLLSAWWALMALYLALRYGAARPERTLARDPGAAEAVTRRVAVGCGISGGLVGALAAIALAQPDPAVHGLTVLIVSVIAALSIMSLHPVMEAWAAFNVSMVALAAAACALADSIPLSMIAAVVLFVAAGSLAFARTLHADLRSRLGQQRRIEQLMRTAEDQARHDPLTGLRNRLWLGEHLAQMAGTQETALVLVDLDGFKQVNDRHGHAVGDAVLRAFAHALATRCRPTDQAARLGGDEFVIVMAGVASHAAADDAVRRVLEAALLSVRLPDGAPCALGASFGVAVVAAGARDAERALAEADAAMYAAKRQRAAPCLEEHLPQLTL